MLAQCEAVARAAAATVPRSEPLRVDATVVELNEPLGTPHDAELVRWLVQRTGRGTASVPYYTEAAIVTSMGATTVVCGPGDIAQAHRVDEYVDLDALEHAADLYRDAIDAFCT
jgi:acetylornithine deacetylase/succinyl-diaminopimelate desuccinylase-like protein